MTHFEVDGFQYRTSGNDVVEGKDGNTWNRCYSLRIILLARKYLASQSEQKHQAEVHAATESCGG